MEAATGTSRRNGKALRVFGLGTVELLLLAGVYAVLIIALVLFLTRDR